MINYFIKFDDISINLIYSTRSIKLNDPQSNQVKKLLPQIKHIYLYLNYIISKVVYFILYMRFL
jgi:hypothetical protein